MIRKGQPWGGEASGPPDVEIDGGDADLARCVVAGSPARRVGYVPSPDADLARAVGLSGASPRTAEVPVDALEISHDDARARVGVNAVVFGTAPDRMTRWTRSRAFEVTIDDRPAWSGSAGGVVVANGQFLRGSDIVPRGHPGDGRIETQVYALRPGERAGMRRRLATGTHLPHPRIFERGGRVVEVVTAGSAAPLEVDGVAWKPSDRIRIVVLPGALRLLV